MNRRDAIRSTVAAALGSATAAAGIENADALCEAISGSEPFMFLISSDVPLTQHQRRVLHKCFADAVRERFPNAPILVLPRGIKVECCGSLAETIGVEDA